MRKKIFMVIVFMATLLVCGNVNAATYARVTNTSADVWSGLGTNYEKITTLKYNDTIPLMNTTLLRSEQDCEEGMYRIDLNGKYGYVCKSNVSISTVTVRLNTDEINVRTGPGTNYDVYKSYNTGKLFTLAYTKKYEGDGCEDGWYRLNLNNDNEKYICSTYVNHYNSKTNAMIMNTKGSEIKKTASSESDTVEKLKYGQAVTVYETTPYEGEGCENGWLKVYYNAYRRYICSDDVIRTNTVYRVNNTAGVNIRNAAKSTGTKIATLGYMKPVVILDTNKITGSGCTDGWYKIKYNNSESYLCSKYVSLAKNTTTTIAKANIRTDKTLSSTIITTLDKNKQLILESTTKLKGSGCTDWYQANFNGKTTYLCSKNTEMGTKVRVTTSSTKKIQSISTASGKYYTTNKWSYRLKENYGYVRTKANTSSAIQNIVYLGTEFDVLSSIAAGNGCAAGWYKVKYYGGTTGYICKSLVEKYSDVTRNDSEYCKTLKNEGFPESYCPFLSYLHYKHPKWVFKAENTGVKFTSAVNGESERNYTQITESAYLQSWSVSEAGGWRTASDAYVAYMLDPRNYLNEQNIFAFEFLGFDSKYHTISAIRSIVKDTYLDTDTYAGYFLAAGELYQVSPVHLASRVKQEGGTNSSYAAVSGKLTNTWTVTKSGYVCTAFGTKDGSNFKINKNASPYVRASSSIKTNILKYSNGNKMTVNSNDTVVLNSSTKYNAIATGGVNVRAETNTKSTILGTLSKNSAVSLVSKTTIKGSNCEAGWYKIKYGSQTGYVCSTYIDPDAGCTSGEWYNVKVNKSLKGIYNYYNIGAYGSNPVIRGVVAAAGFVDDNDGTPWNTREKAIKYGASFIANGYINQGQDTLYYQKFNTGPNASAIRYTHQYMTNILAPASESLSTYDSYSELGLLNKAYVFKIPVYNSMPTWFTTHPPVK